MNESLLISAGLRTLVSNILKGHQINQACDYANNNKHRPRDYLSLRDFFHAANFSLSNDFTTDSSKKRKVTGTLDRAERQQATVALRLDHFQSKQSQKNFYSHRDSEK
jgi:hypothetical protein